MIVRHSTIAPREGQAIPWSRAARCSSAGTVRRRAPGAVQEQLRCRERLDRTVVEPARDRAVRVAHGELERLRNAADLEGRATRGGRCGAGSRDGSPHRVEHSRGQRLQDVLHRAPGDRPGRPGRPALRRGFGDEQPPARARLARGRRLPRSCCDEQRRTGRVEHLGHRHRHAPHEEDTAPDRWPLPPTPRAPAGCCPGARPPRRRCRQRRRPARARSPGTPCCVAGQRDATPPPDFPGS
jgi:hypothetical protein